MKKLPDFRQSTASALMQEPDIRYARYYFHLTDGKQPPNNHTAIVLSGTAAACEDVLALARDLKHGAVMPG